MKKLYRIKRHLGRGKYYQFWQIRNNYTNAEIGYYDWRIYSLILENCQLISQPTAAKKILNGANRKPCAWIKCDRFEIVPSDRIKVDISCPIFYDPCKIDHWKDRKNQNIDKQQYSKIITLATLPYVQTNAPKQLRLEI